MFYNIFKKLSWKKTKIIPLIIADIHEKNSLILSELHKSTHVRLEIRSLKIADYIIGEIALERKTISDLISSMINKRLIQQLMQMKKYKKSILIIEGDLEEIYQENDNISKALRGFILSIIVNYNTSIIFAKDYEDTAKYLITLSKQQLKPKTPVSFHSRIPKSLKEQKQYILESFPNIGPKKAEKLLKKFKTIKNVVNSSEEELSEILKSRADNFKRITDS